MSSVFVDTSALLALLDRSDRDHSRVRASLEEIGRGGSRLVSTSYVLVEADALVRRRIGLRAARALAGTARRSLDIVWVDAGLHARAWDESLVSGRKGPGLVDHVSFITMRDLAIDRALTLDRHFARQGFEIIP